MSRFDIEMLVSHISRGIYRRFKTGKLEEIASRATLELVPVDLKPFLSRIKGQGNLHQSLRNLNNAWYSECFLSYPSLRSFKPNIVAGFDEDISKDMNRHLEILNRQFIAWKYIVSYYSIFFALSAMLRAIDTSNKGGHKVIISAFNSRFCSKKFPSDFLLFPLKLGNSSSGSDGILDEVGGLESSKQERKAHKTTSLLHTLYSMRQKINYQIMHKFARTKKKRYPVFFTLNLKRIVFVFSLMAEVFLIRCYGYQNVCQEFRAFRRKMGSSSLSAYPVSMRFDTYEKHLKDLRGVFQK